LSDAIQSAVSILPVVNITNVTLRENTSSGSRALSCFKQTDGRTDGRLGG